MGGLADFAATKMNDKQTHFPGPGSYQPRLDPGRHISIANRSAGVNGSDSGRSTTREIGPGKYDIKSTVGEGPRISFSPRLGDKSPSGSPRRPSSGRGKPLGSAANDIPRQYCMSQTPGSPRCSLHGRTAPNGTGGSSSIPGPGQYSLTSTLDKRGILGSAANDIPRQYCMSQTPGSPRCSLHGRTAPNGTGGSSSIPGPGQYSLTSTLDKRGITLSARFDIQLGDAAEVPGPGNYDVARFGDRIPLPKPPHIPHAAPRIDDRPGPGAYDAHGTIAERTSPRQRIPSDPLFGAKVHPPVGGSIAPGPGTYTNIVGTFSEGLNHGKGVTMGSRNNPSGELESIYPKPGPCEYTIPGNFGVDARKGFTLHSRREDPPPKLIVPGPGQYHPGGSVAETVLNSRQGTKFNGSKPFQKGAEYKAPRIDGIPGPGAYAPVSAITSPRVKGFAFNSRGDGRHDNPFVDWAAAPGPGTYNPKLIHTQEAAPGYTFHKGPF
ncbi:Hypothetical protein, putative [Bodo saltans]|uniref:Uncharacterized protein n=1 Tax=Bodo saltans TaxID=75058 RepID=A0A0S4JMR6_BODSA|nr:Hypothetical protein, putative [Bodo saltans]|eukprot:CUG92760.1 Hypothetical protein, putative [Bodo saltans]